VASVGIDAGQLDLVSSLGGTGGRPGVLFFDRGWVAAQAYREGHGDVCGRLHPRVAGDRGPRASGPSVRQRLVGVPEQPMRRGHAGEQPGMVDRVSLSHGGAAVDLERAARFILLLMDLAEPPRDRCLNRGVASGVIDLAIGREGRGEVTFHTVGITKQEVDRLIAGWLGHCVQEIHRIGGLSTQN